MNAAISPTTEEFDCRRQDDGRRRRKLSLSTAVTASVCSGERHRLYVILPSMLQAPLLLLPLLLHVLVALLKRRHYNHRFDEELCYDDMFCCCGCRNCI